MLPASLPGFPINRRYLVAVSGGRDSVALLHWLRQKNYARLIVCHLDHGLRARVARADAEFVRRLATKWKCPAEIEHVAVNDLARSRKQSLETAGRAARLEFFARVAKARRCLTIFLGHHADDQVETFLLRLFRGAGARGLGAMREVSRIGSLEIVRPFLGVWRSEIDTYVAANGLKFREDATNATLNARRNLLRHQVIPQLEAQFGPGLRQNLWRAANLLAEEDALIDELVPNDLCNGDGALPVKRMGALAVVLQRRAILRWLRAGKLNDIGFMEVEAVRDLLKPDQRVAKVNLPNDRHARRRSGKIFLE